MAKYHCERCNTTMDEVNFYTYKNGEKTELCKKCLTAHVDNYNPETFLWILEKMDVPYVVTEWNKIRDTEYQKNPLKMNGMSVLGRYLSKMKLKQFKNYSWKDTEALQEKAARESRYTEAEKIKQEEEMRAALERGEITKAQYETFVAPDYAEMPAMTMPAGQPPQFFNENDFIKEDDLPDPSAELTKEDKLFLAMKWGRFYKPSDWVELEKKYNEMMSSFDIQDADSKNSIILICKINLKMNEAIDQGDMDTFQKLSRSYESLRKSTKLTAAQNKEQKSDYVDSIGEFVAMCEREEGFIPRYAIDIPQDKVDQTLKDMNNYLYKLVTQDLGFGQQIEDALRKIQIQKEMNESEKDNDEDYELTDEDHKDYYDLLEEQKQKDNKLFSEESDN